MLGVTDYILWVNIAITFRPLLQVSASAHYRRMFALRFNCSCCL